MAAPARGARAGRRRWLPAGRRQRRQRRRRPHSRPPLFLRGCPASRGQLARAGISPGPATRPPGSRLPRRHPARLPQAGRRL